MVTNNQTELTIFVAPGGGERKLLLGYFHRHLLTGAHGDPDRRDLRTTGKELFVYGLDRLAIEQECLVGARESSLPPEGRSAVIGQRGLVGAIVTYGYVVAPDAHVVELGPLGLRRQLRKGGQVLIDVMPLNKGLRGRARLELDPHQAGRERTDNTVGDFGVLPAVATRQILDDVISRLGPTIAVEDLGKVRRAFDEQRR